MQNIPKITWSASENEFKYFGYAGFKNVFLFFIAALVFKITSTLIHVISITVIHVHNNKQKILRVQFPLH